MANEVANIVAKNSIYSLIDIIKGFDLTSGLQLCLDAGDIDSYPGSGIKWLDTSGNGYDFNLGDGSTATTYPTFNGSAGALSKNEFFSFDGGDYFSYDSANETWMDQLHNDGAVVSFIIVHAASPTTTILWFSTCIPSANGFYFYTYDSNTAETVIRNTGVSAATTLLSAGWFHPTNESKFAIGGSSWSENGGTVREVMSRGVSFGPYSADNPQSNSNTPGAFTIGAQADKTSKAPSGSKIACLAMWTGVALSRQNLIDIYSLLAKRFT